MSSQRFSWIPLCLAVLAACGTPEVNIPKIKVPVVDPNTDDSTPTATDASVTTDEDTAVTVEFAVAASAAAVKVTVTIDTEPAHGTLTVAGDTYTYTPAADYNGEDTITFHGEAGGVKSATATVTVTINPINDAPAFTKGGDENVDEDAAPVSVAGWATGLSEGPNEAEQTLSFSVTNDNNSLFATQPAVSAAGDLTYTLAADANGSATVTVHAMDNAGTDGGGVDRTADQSFVITVNAVNDAPSFTKGADQTPAEDAAPVTVNGWATNISAGPADEAAQTYAFVVTNDNNALFSTQPTVSTAGVLSFALTPNAFGTANVSVALQDNGGTALGGGDRSADQPLIVTVTSVNDLPTQPTIALHPANYRGGDDIWVEIATPSTDDDAGASITYEKRWYLNGSTTPESFATTATSVNQALLTPLDTWKVVVTPHDGIGNGVTAWAIKTIPTDWQPTDVDDADLPVARMIHTAVWTGSEMIVWGGYTTGYNTKTNTGGRYNPVTNSWLPVSTTGEAPSARSFHTAVWTGHEMIVWGGFGAFSLNSGAHYNPATDIWTVMATDPAAEARSSHAAVWTGKEMLIWGGGTDTVSVNSGARYDPVAGSWSAMSATTTTPRYDLSAVWTGSEMIIWGGFDGAVTNTGGRYDPDADTWRSISLTGAPAARYDHIAVWTGSEMIVWGGGTDTSNSVTNTGGRYNPRTDTWSATSVAGGVPSGRKDLAGVWTGRELIIWGGYTGDISNTGGRYDPFTNTWKATELSSQTPVARDTHTAVWTGRDMIVWGGRDGNDNSGRNTGGRYTPPAATEAWTATGTSGGPPPLMGNSLVWTGSEMIVWAGSIDGAFLPANTGSRYNPATDTWTATGTGAGVPAARNFHAAVWTGREMIVWGGNNGGTWGGQYNPATDTWVATGTNGSVPTGRTNPKAVWTGREMIAWGGVISGTAQDTGVRYEPLTGTWAATSMETDAPSARGSHTAVWTGRVMIVWGGEYSGTVTNTGARYDPLDDTWAATSIVAAPVARDNQTAVWTGSEMIVWGGYGGGVNWNTGGRYNPLTDSWTATSVAAGVPSARSYHTAVWSGREMIVWGGSAPVTATGGRYDPATDTWIATGTGAGLPAARNWHSAIWTGREMIVWGGIISTFTNTGGRYVP